MAQKPVLRGEVGCACVARLPLIKLSNCIVQYLVGVSQMDDVVRPYRYATSKLVASS